MPPYPQYANQIAGPQSVNSMAGLEGLSYAGDSMDRQVAALEGLDAEELGRRHRAQTHRGGPPQHALHAPPQHQMFQQQMPLNVIQPQIPGSPARGLRKVPLPIGSVTFTNVSGTSLVLIGRTQRPYKGVRLILDFARIGATAVGLLTVTDIRVGQDVQPAAAGAMPLAGFGVQVWDADLDLTPITPGIELQVTCGISVAPGAGDSVSIAGMLIGYSVQG